MTDTKPSPASTGPVFEDVDVPAVTKGTTIVNPYAEKVAELIGTWDDENGRSTKAAAVTVPTAALDRTQRQISSAGVALGKSMRQIRENCADTDPAMTKIVFWAVEKIVRSPRPATT